MHESVPRSTTGSSVLVMVAERHGISEDVALRGSGVSRELLDSVNGEVTREQEVVIVSNIVAQLDGSVGVGAEVGMHYHLKTFGVWGFALLSSPTLRSALQTGVQFLDLTFALSRIAVREIEDETRLYFDVSHLPPDIRGFVLERDGLGIRTIQLELLGEVMPLRRIVTQQPGTPEDQELLSQLLQADVTMNAPVTFASFDRDLLDQPVLNSDPTLTKLAVQQCEQALAARRSRVVCRGRARGAHRRPQPVGRHRRHRRDPAPARRPRPGRVGHGYLAGWVRLSRRHALGRRRAQHPQGPVLLAAAAHQGLRGLRVRSQTPHGLALRASRATHSRRLPPRHARPSPQPGFPGARRARAVLSVHQAHRRPDDDPLG